MLLVSNIGLVATGIAAAYSVNLIMLISMRFLNGIFVAGARNSAFVYCKFATNLTLVTYEPNVNHLLDQVTA